MMPTGYKRITKKTVFPEVQSHRLVTTAAVLGKGLHIVMFTVPKYSRGWMTKYKSYEAALKAKPHIKHWR